MTIGNTTPPSATDVFLPLLQKFCSEAEKLNENELSIFLPHVMKGYTNAKQKIFYFGQDTVGWTRTAELMNAYKNNQLKQYITGYDEWLNENGFLDYNNNNAFGFWTLIVKLHLRIKGIKVSNSIGSDFHHDENLSLLNDFGYGNVNSMELEESLKKHVIWEQLNTQNYLTLKQQSIEIFDKLKHTIDVYNPDLVFIFNWGSDHEKFLEGLKYEIEKMDHVNGYFWKITLSSGTKVFWTVHPNNLRFQGLNIDKFVDEIIPCI